MSYTDWTRGLNPEQIEAVLHDEGPLLILAGAGSGKTTVLVSRTGRLIDEGVAHAKQMLVLTFTNKAAKELKHRVEKKVGARAEGLWAGTFHSFGLWLLKRFAKQAGLPNHFAVIDSGDSQAILKDLMKETKIGGKDRFDMDRLLNLIHEARSGEALKHEAQDEYHEAVEMLKPRYEKRLDLLGVVDFESLLLKPIELFENNPDVLERVRNEFKQIMVDEFQDTNGTQMKLIRLLADGHRNIAVVGDDDQSIYGWRGARIQNILEFPSNWSGCKVVKLERNYRSSPSILKLANEVISKNKTRHGKNLKPSKNTAEDVTPELFILENEEEEGEFVVAEIRRARELGLRPSDIAVLYRSNTQGGLLESALRRNRIEYKISGGTSIFERKEAKDVMAYLRQALMPNDVAFRRILNTPARGVGDTTLEKIAIFAKDHSKSFIETARRWKEIGVHAGAGEGIDRLFRDLLRLPNTLLDPSKKPGEHLLEYLKELGYRAEVMNSGTQAGAGEKKWQVVEIVARILDSYVAKKGLTRQSLIDFLDAMSLREETDDDKEEKVQLMTFHASKGLEFPFVILAGIEEDLLPHRSLGGDLDEERRLFYVGITRAQNHLILSRCRNRQVRGSTRPVAPSRFLLDLVPGLYKENHGAFRPVSGQAREDLVAGFLKKFEKPDDKKSKPI